MMSRATTVLLCRSLVLARNIGLCNRLIVNGQVLAVSIESIPYAAKRAGIHIATRHTLAARLLVQRLGHVLERTRHL